METSLSALLDGILQTFFLFESIVLRLLTVNNKH